MAIAPHDRSTQPSAHPDFARTIDMRCSATLTAGAHAGVRCQLLIGHDGGHALMYSDGGARRVLVWTAGADPRSVPGDWRSLAWMRGFPAPAWFERDH
jgi:hypothetical protein